MEEYIKFFMDIIYPNVVNGEYSKIVFKFLTTEVFLIINNNLLLLLVFAKVFKVISGWTSNTWDDKLAGKFTAFLENRRVLSTQKEEKKDEKITVKEL